MFYEAHRHASQTDYYYEFNRSKQIPSKIPHTHSFKIPHTHPCKIPHSLFKNSDSLQEEDPFRNLLSKMIFWPVGIKAKSEERRCKA